MSGLKGGKIDLEVKGNIAVIKINHEAKHNALTGSMMLDFDRIVHEELPKFNGKAIVLTGKGID